MTELSDALSGPVEIEGELASEFLLIASTIGNDDRPGSYRVVMGPDSLPLHSRIGLLSMLEHMTDTALMGAGDGDD